MTEDRSKIRYLFKKVGTSRKRIRAKILALIDLESCKNMVVGEYLAPIGHNCKKLTKLEVITYRLLGYISNDDLK